MEWRGLAAAACFTRLRCLLMDLYTPLLAGNGGAEALNAAMARLPHLHSLCLEGTYSSGWGTEVVPASNSAVLDVAAVPLLSQLTGLELRRVHLGGGVFSSLGRLTALCRLQGELLPLIGPALCLAAARHLATPSAHRPPSSCALAFPLQSSRPTTWCPSQAGLSTRSMATSQPCSP